jgi:copper chaperone NosL
MVIASRLTAAQIDAPGDEPRFFDEIGCLRDYLANLATPLTEGAVVFVADHRTGDWVDANRAIFTRTAIQTPMPSGIVAHADERSRDADLSLSVGTPVGREDILRPARQRGAS